MTILDNPQTLEQFLLPRLYENCSQCVLWIIESNEETVSEMKNTRQRFSFIARGVEEVNLEISKP